MPLQHRGVQHRGCLGITIITLTILLTTSAATLKLRWKDEFNKATINSKVWSFDLGDGSAYGVPGWGNSELQCYTNRSSNSAIIPDPDNKKKNKLLAITGLAEPNHDCYNGPESPSSRRAYTSAKLITRGKKSFMYPPGGAVRMEARVKVPLALGTWSAFWALPEANEYGGWCASGEIDIMEHINNESTFYGNLYYGGIKGGNSGTNCKSRMGRKDVGADEAGKWHVHAVEWSADYIAYRLDDQEYHRVNSSAWWSGSALNKLSEAPFDKPFYLVLNLALGGEWPRFTIAEGPHRMLVDWVRVWDVLP